jgi:hypothetical protein
VREKHCWLAAASQPNETYIIVYPLWDPLVWRWTPDERYSIRSAYRTYFVGWASMTGAKELWRAHGPPKVKFFF